MKIWSEREKLLEEQSKVNFRALSQELLQPRQELHHVDVDKYMAMFQMPVEPVAPTKVRGLKNYMTLKKQLADHNQQQEELQRK